MPTSLAFVLLAACTCLALWHLLLRVFIRSRPEYAHLRHIKGPDAASAWTGNMGQFFARGAANWHRQLARQYGPIVKLNGFLGDPVLYISDPRALHHILIKDEAIFQETPEYILSNTLFFGPHTLISSLGEQHSKQRKLLNPAFSINHMRRMIPIFYHVTHKLRNAILSRVREKEQEIDMLAWMSRTALELMGQAGLGYSFDPLEMDSTDQYGYALKSLAPAMRSLLVFSKVAIICHALFPAWMNRAIVNLFPKGTIVHSLKETVKILSSRSRQIYDSKKRALEKGDTELLTQVAEGKDVMSIFMRANAGADSQERLSEDEVAEQMSVLIFGATDTTSNVLSRVLQLLAENPEVQEKLREELLGAGAADGLAYDELNHLRFLDSVCRETLRVYPPATILFRVATKDTVLPLAEPIDATDGSRMDDIPVPAGTQILVDFLGCNTSRKIWGQDAYEWKPERWMSPLPQTVTDARIPGIYPNLMTFIGGKRACIGYKFAEMELKVVLSVLVSSFTFEKLPDKPIEWNVAPIWYPTVGKFSNVPQLPLRVRVYKASQV